ncbi:MAG: ATP-grasp domain-containing protein, partial [Candidatus Bathyarchaeia archaeon]
MVNCNPETVSTDFDVLDKLYFEELTYERVMDIIEKERPLGVVVSVGGQTPNNLALRLAKQGVRLLGTEAASIDLAEDRAKFSKLLDEIGIEQPRWRMVESTDEAKAFAEEVGYPVLVRPSYILSGSAVSVALDEDQLEMHLEKAALVSRGHPVVVSKFLVDAKEIDVDAVSDGRNVFIGAIVEHIEKAGVHSGDATMVVPTLTLDGEILEKIRRSTRMIARSLGIKGPFNIQYLVKDGRIWVIECNLRASRSMPYVSKSVGVNLMALAARALMGGEVPDGEGVPRRYCVKAPQFSFMRLDSADPVTGVEMVSTGEVACFGDRFEEALIMALIASGIKLPERGDPIMISVGREKDEAVKIAKKIEARGFKIYATEHTAQALRRDGVDCETIHKVRDGVRPNALDFIEEGKLKLIINTPSPDKMELETITDGYLIRRKAVEFGVPIITNLELAESLAEALMNHEGEPDLHGSRFPRRERALTMDGD